MNIITLVNCGFSLHVISEISSIDKTLNIKMCYLDIHFILLPAAWQDEMLAAKDRAYCIYLVCRALTVQLMMSDFLVMITIQAM